MALAQLERPSNLKTSSYALTVMWVLDATFPTYQELTLAPQKTTSCKDKKVAFKESDPEAHKTCPQGTFPVG